MKLRELHIINFRNFENISIELNNKNVVFGMNDAGKTNFLWALRFLLDKKIRRDGFTMTDYHKHNTDDKIVITLKVDLSDYEESEDTKKLVSKLNNSDVRNSQDGDDFYIQLEAEYNDRELVGEPIMKWGSNINDLQIMNSRGMSYPIDDVIEIVYIDPLMDLERLFDKNRKYIFDEYKNTDEDKELMNGIEELTNEMNMKIGNMSSIKEFQSEITNEYKNLNNENIEIELKSEMAINGIYSDLKPYIKKRNDGRHYPTSGDGRRKLLSYSLINYINKRKYEDKIVIYLLEEPENNLHRSMQISLSKQIFEDNIYEYLFMSTHSSQVLYEMDRAMLIRIYTQENIECKSYMYQIDEKYKTTKKKLNREFSDALFYNKVLLIEGPSEKVLFEKVLDEINPHYEYNGGCIVQVLGTHFKSYRDAFNGLDIKVIIKTDNDLKSKKNDKHKFELLGINRCLKLINKEGDNDIDILFDDNINKGNKEALLRSKKQMIFNDWKSNGYIDKFEKENIYLSEIDLENDLYTIIPDSMANILDKNKDKVVKYLQDRKLLHMVELVEGLSKEDCENIYNHEKFRCLRELE